ncbi:MAG: bacterioferritin [Gammaproteobacteria bacterium]|jgi:bacterioferritin|nr:bacterioferritin [Gammaproteobacteria bacterium]
MKGNTKVLAHLQSLLNCELTARDQYLAHSRLYRDMGLHKLYERLNHEMEEETEHADLLIERMLFLEATPDYNQQGTVNPGTSVPEMLQLDLDVEYAVGAALKEAIAVCEQEQDYDSRRILCKLLDDTEMDHAYWLERQLRLIDLVGLPNYLQSQMG